MALPFSIVEKILELRLGKTTSLQIVQQCFENIDLWEDQVKAWVSIDRDYAIQRAEELDRLASDGKWQGPLHGMPIGIKDIIDVRGVPTLAGSKLRSQHIATNDATIVQRLRDAGAIILGKTVTTELACFDPPITKNPWNLNCTPGGSSSGSAAAVATGMCLAAIGSQTGGSITRPASYCGASGMKASFGRVSRNGVVMVSKNLDHVGPIARRVADLALIMRVIAGHDPKDSHTSSEPFLANAVPSNEDSKPKFKVLQSWFEQSTPEVAAVMNEAVSKLRDADAKIETARLPGDFEEIITQHRVIMAAEVYQEHAELFDRSPERFGPNVSSLLSEGREVSDEAYQQALKHQADFKTTMNQSLQRDEVWLTPATDSTAPEDLTTTGSPRFNSPWSYCGLPTLSIPCQLASNRLPVCVQLIGNYQAEAELIKAALWCERVFNFQNVATLVGK